MVKIQSLCHCISRFVRGLIWWILTPYIYFFLEEDELEVGASNKNDLKLWKNGDEHKTKVESKVVAVVEDENDGDDEGLINFNIEKGYW